MKKIAFAGSVHALRFTLDGQYLLAGIGPYLTIFHVLSGDCVWRQHVFNGGCIKEIKIIQDNRFVVFGQRNIHIYELDNNTVVVEKIFEFEERNDWILDVTFLDKNTCAIGFARNIVQIVQINNNTIVRTIHGHPNCLLYSMAFYGDSIDNLIVASGTIFSEICIWSLNNSNIAPLVLRGHDGVLFRLIWSDGNTICSTSDDRTVRLWKLSQDLSSVASSIVMYGHTARVWDCKLTNDFIVSCGEDKTVRVWDYDGNCIHVFRGHQSKNVWRIDVDPTQSIIASGGGDSAIKLWSLDTVRVQLQGATHKQYILPGMDMKNSKEFTRYLKCFGNSDVFVVTNNAYLYRVNNDNGDIDKVYDDHSNRSFVCFDVSPCGRYCALGDSNGNCVVANLQDGSRVLDLPVFPSGRILNIYWRENHNDSSCCLFLTSPFGDLKQIFTEFTIDTCLFKEARDYKAKNRLLSICYVREHELLLAGDNRGHIHTFLYSTAINHSSDVIIAPVHTLFNVHGKENVSDIKFINFDKIYSVGRDASVVSHKLIQLDRLVSVRTTKLNCIVPTLTNIHVSGQKDIIVYGFYGPQFVVYDFTRNYRIASLNFGSAKGSFDVIYTPASTYFTAYSKGGVLHTFTEPKSILNEQSKFEKESLNLNFHGKEVNDVLFWRSHSSNKTRVITASEDTTIRIMEYNTNSNHQPLHSSSVLSDHVNGVKALSLIELNNDNYILFSGGGKEELLCWKLSDDKDERHVECVLRIPSLTDKYLGVFHSEIQLNEKKKSTVQFRIMSMCSFLNNNDCSIIVTGSSDGLIKVRIKTN
jgi:WD40 repeat protein